MQLRCSGAGAGADSTTQRPSVVQSLCDKWIHLKDVKSWHWMKLRQNRTLSPVCCRGICRGAKPGLFATRSHSPKKPAKSEDQNSKHVGIKGCKKHRNLQVALWDHQFWCLLPFQSQKHLTPQVKKQAFESWEYCAVDLSIYSTPHHRLRLPRSVRTTLVFLAQELPQSPKHGCGNVISSATSRELVLTMFIMASRYLNDFEKPQSPTHVYGYEFIFLLWMIFKLSSSFVPDVPGQNTGLPTGHGPAFQVCSHSVVNRIRLNKDKNKTRVQILKTNFPLRSENQSSLDIGYGLFSGRLLDCLMRQCSARSNIRGLDGELMQLFSDRN